MTMRPASIATDDDLDRFDELHHLGADSPDDIFPLKKNLPKHVHNINDLHIRAAIATIERAIDACREHPGELATEEFYDAGRLLRLHANAEWVPLRVKIRAARPPGVRMEDVDAGTKPPGSPADDFSVADELVALVTGRAELFHARDGACFAALRESPRRIFRLDTSLFADWLSYSYYRATETPDRPGRAASKPSIDTARMVLSGIARNDSEEREVFLRCGRRGSVYYLDLGCDAWRVVEISANGWRIIDNSPVAFFRSSTARPLPDPARDGDLERLWQFANIPADDQPMVKAWLLECLRPETPFCVLELVGPQGSAKSSTQARLRSLIDPNAVDLRAHPKSVEDLFVSAGVNWMCSLNNLSHLNAGLQDALCSLATGGGFAGRTLHTNADETLIEAKRPVAINGIVPLVTQQDLTDRVIHIELPEIAAYRSEGEIRDDFERAAPAILGGLLDLFVATLRQLEHVSLPRPPRMADYARLGEAMMRAEGHRPGAFVDIYHANRRSSIARSLEASPVAVAVREMMDSQLQHGSEPPINETMKALLERLSAYRGAHDSQAWPKHPRGLGDALRRQMPALAQLGIRIDISKPGRDGVTVRIWKTDDRAREHGERRERGLGDFYPTANISKDMVI